MVNIINYDNKNDMLDKLTDLYNTNKLNRYILIAENQKKFIAFDFPYDENELTEILKVLAEKEKTYKTILNFADNYNEFFDWTELLDYIADNYIVFNAEIAKIETIKAFIKSLGFK